MLIEKNIPMPKSGPGRKAYSLEIPFDEMEVGDSVLAKEDGAISNNFASLVKVRAHRHGKLKGRTYLTAKVDGGIRVWRQS